MQMKADTVAVAVLGVLIQILQKAGSSLLMIGAGREQV